MAMLQPSVRIRSKNRKDMVQELKRGVKSSSPPHTAYLVLSKTENYCLYSPSNKLIACVIQQSSPLSLLTQEQLLRLRSAYSMLAVAYTARTGKPLLDIDSARDFCSVHVGSWTPYVDIECAYHCS